jgi:hypothetical protein
VVGAPVLRQLLKVNPCVRFVALDSEDDEHESIAWADAGANARLTKQSSTKLKTRGADGQPLWAYRYRLGGRSSERRQVGGFATRAEAEKALRRVLDRLGPGGGRATITLAEFDLTGSRRRG